MSDIIPLMNFFGSKSIPFTKQLQTLTFTKIDGKPFKGYIFKGKKCLTLEQLTEHIPNGQYKTVAAAFRRARKDYNMKSGKDFTKIRGNNLLPLGFKQRKEIFLLFQTAIVLTLANMRKEFKSTLLYKLVHYYFDMEEKKQKYINYQPENVYLLPQMGEKLLTKHLWQVDSKIEVIVANILHDLKIPFQPAPVYHNLRVVPDFLITTEPQTIIECWGYEEKEQHNWKYQNNRKRKEEIYKKLGWKVLNIENSEVKNIPKLTEKVRKYFIKK